MNNINGIKLRIKYGLKLLNYSSEKTFIAMRFFNQRFNVASSKKIKIINALEMDFKNTGTGLEKGIIINF